MDGGEEAGLLDRRRRAFSIGLWTNLKDRQGADGKDETISEECGVGRNLRRGPGGVEKTDGDRYPGVRGAERQQFLFSWEPKRKPASGRKWGAVCAASLSTAPPFVHLTAFHLLTPTFLSVCHMFK